MAFGGRFILERRFWRSDCLVLFVFHVANFGLVGVDSCEAVDEDKVARYLVFVYLVFDDEWSTSCEGQISWSIREIDASRNVPLQVCQQRSRRDRDIRGLACCLRCW